MQPSGEKRASTPAAAPPGNGGLPERSFRRRTLLFGAGALVAAIALTAFGLRLLAREREQAFALWEARLSATAADREAALEAWIVERQNDASVVGSFPSIREILAGGPGAEPPARSRAHATEILAQVARVKGLEAIAVLDVEGRLAVSSDPAYFSSWVPPAREPSGREGRKSVRFTRLDGGTPVIAVEVAVPGPSGQPPPSGHVLLLVSPARFVYPLLARSPVPSATGESFLVRRQGDRVVYLSPLRFVAVAPGSFTVPSSTEALAAAWTLSEGEGSGRARDYRGTEVLAAGRRIPGTDWGLVAKVDVEEALAPATKVARRGVVVLVALFAGLAAATWGIWRNEHVYRLRALARSSDQYRLFLSQARDAILFVEPTTGRILEANPAAEAMYGRSSDELRAMTVAELRVEEERGAVPTLIAQARSEGILAEATHVKADGTTFPVEISSRRAEADGKEILISILRDVSERVEARETEKLLNRLVRTTSEVNRLIVRERDGQRLLAEACRIAVEHGGFSLAFVSVPDAEGGRLVPGAAFGLTDYLDGIEIRTDESPLGRGPTGLAWREGRPVVVDDWETDATVEPWRERAGRLGIRASGAFPLGKGSSPAGVLTVYSDSPGFFRGEVTNLVAELADNLAFALAAIAEEERRLAAERALAESERTHRLLFASNPAPMWVVDSGTLRFLEVNDSALAHYGYSRDEFLSMNLRDIRPPEDVEAMEKVARDAREGIRQAGTWRHRRKDGSIIEVEIVTHDIPYGGAAARLVLASDVTAKRQAEREVLRLNAELEERVRTRTAELEAANRDLESFAYSVSHDLRAPLRAIDGFGKILEDAHVDRLDAEGKRLLGIVRTNAKKMGTLIDDLLAFSRAGRHEIRKARVDMRLLAAAVWTEVLPEDERERSNLVLGPVPDALGDAALLRQVWANLLSNAVKFTSKNPSRRVEVGGRRGPDGPEWYVKDDGVGFDMRYAGRLFGVFSRLHGPREFDGTGVGLALVHKIVTRHGGTVRGEAEPGKGATFTFSLPDAVRPARSVPFDHPQEASWTRSES